MTGFKFLVTLIVLQFFLMSCDHKVKPSADYMVLNQIEYVDKFPYSFEMKNSKEANWEIIGLQYFEIQDTLFLASTMNRDSLWSFYSVNTHELLGSFLRMGNGPYEFVSKPNLFETTFLHSGNELLADVYDSSKGLIYEMNISKSLREGMPAIRLLQDSIPNRLFNIAVIDSQTFFCKSLEENVTKQVRYILNKKKEKQVIPANLELLNRVRIPIKEDINMISTIVRLNDEHDKIVEMPIGLNQLNLYSVFEDFGKTICVGDHISSIDEIQAEKPQFRPYTYADIRTYKDFFAALYIGDEQMAYQIERTKKPIIQFFDWSGKPLAELKIDRHVTSFDIDFTNKQLYMYDLITDQLYLYDLSQILDVLL